MAQNPTSKKPDLPICDLSQKIDDPWTREECIAELRRIVDYDPARYVSRNYFRNVSRIKELVWNRHFGSFQEFKRGANVLLSRHAHRMELDIAKHSSVTAMREMNESKQGYEDKYLRPNPARFQTVIHITDVHDKNCDPFYRRVLMDTFYRVQPDKLIIGGDLFDLPEFGRYSIDPREWDVVGRIKWVHEFLADVRVVAPNTEITLVEGNHEYRLLRHLSEATQGMRVILSDLHGFTVPKLLGLEQFEVNYVSKSDLGSFTKRDVDKEISKNYYIAYKCYLVHHFPAGESYEMPGAHGHHHAYWVRHHHGHTFGSYQWSQLGCGHRRSAVYCEAEKWSLGFQIAHIDTVNKRVNPEYVHIGETLAVVGGRFYERNTDEFVVG